MKSKLKAKEAPSYHHKMANNQLPTSIKNPQDLVDYNSNYYNNLNNNNLNINNNNNNITLDRLVTKFGDIVTPKYMKNLQNINLPLGLSSDTLKPPSDAIHSLSEQIDFLNSTSSDDESDYSINNTALTQSIEDTLRDAKLLDSEAEGGEVYIPSDLSSRVANEIFALAEDEPCGVRGCTIYIDYEDKSKSSNNRRLGRVRCDSTTVPTFEVVLTLRQESSWLRLLPIKGCWKKIKNKAVILSSNYSLAKNKLYRSNQQL